MVDAWLTAGRDHAGRQLHPVLMTSYFAARLAEALLAQGEVDVAAEWLDRLLADRGSERERFWDVELLRLRADVARIRGAPAEVVREDLEAALALAEQQRAHGLAGRLAEGLGTRAAG
jgi:hypothetical protein